MDAPGIHLEGHLGNMLWEHAILFFVGVKRKKKQHPVWQSQSYKMAAFASIGSTQCGLRQGSHASIQLEVLGL